MAITQITTISVFHRNHPSRNAVRRGLPGISASRPWMRLASTTRRTATDEQVTDPGPVVSGPYTVEAQRTSGFHRLESEPNVFNLPEYPQRAAPPAYVPGTWGGLGAADPNNFDDDLPPYRSSETLRLPPYGHDFVAGSRSSRAMRSLSRGDVWRWHGAQADPQRLEESGRDVGQGHIRAAVDIAGLAGTRLRRCWTIVIVLGLLLALTMIVLAAALKLLQNAKPRANI